MSCKDCEEIQLMNAHGKSLGFMRVGNGNVLIGACDKHFNELRKKILGDDTREVVRMNYPVSEWNEYLENKM